MLDFLTFTAVIELSLIGLVAGLVGGMLGVGGSVILIPGMVIVFGYERTAGLNQHVYQAAAMITNVAVSVPAAWGHHRARAVRIDVLRWMLPASVVFVLVGVWLSNMTIFEGPAGGIWLGRILALFLIYVIVTNVISTIRGLGQSRRARAGARGTSSQTHSPAAVVDAAEDQGAGGSPRAGLVGLAMGVTAGLLGIGGGSIAVPMQHALLRLPLRNCIANSSLVICFSAAIGAIYKNATLYQHRMSQAGAELATRATTAGGEPLWVHSLIIAAVLGPLAFVTGRLGATLTHRLPIQAVRVAFIVLMVVAAWKLAAL